MKLSHPMLISNLIALKQLITAEKKLNVMLKYLNVLKIKSLMKLLSRVITNVKKINGIIKDWLLQKVNFHILNLLVKIVLNQKLVLILKLIQNSCLFGKLGKNALNTLNHLLQLQSMETYYWYL